MSHHGLQMSLKRKESVQIAKEVAIEELASQFLSASITSERNHVTSEKLLAFSSQDILSAAYPYISNQKQWLIFLAAAQMRIEFVEHIEEAIEYLKKAKILERNILIDTELRISVNRYLARAYRLIGDNSSALSTIDEAIQDARDLKSVQWYIIEDKGNILDAIGLYIEAERAYSEASRKASEAAVSPLELGELHYNWSFPLQKRGDTELSRAHIITALQFFGAAIDSKIGFQEKHPIPPTSDKILL